MSNLCYQIFVKKGAGRGEKEPVPSWEELSKNQYGFYEETLWEEKNERVYFTEMDDHEYPEGGVGLTIGSNCGRAEVWAGKQRLIGYNDDIVTEQGITLIPDSPFAAGVVFDRPNQSIEMAIILNNQTVRELRIVSVAE